MVADGIATYGGWCLADVIAMVDDGIATSQLISILVLRCLTEPHPIYVADGICLHFYLGMDC